MPSPRRSLPSLTELAPPPASPHRGTPRRAARLVRRTSHLNVTWPEGREADVHIDAAARDLVTLAAGEPVTAGTAQLNVTVDWTRVVGTDGCTHLNDALRALAEVPVLVAEFTAAGTDGHQAGTA
jgi:hypothetical protein